jgi:diadenosine tetraphosphate (Ap4A) HIT family hydrolase
MKGHEKNPNAHLTAKERDKVSFPTRWLFRQKLLKGSVLDYGCGFGSDVTFLNENGFEATGYDPHYQPNYPQNKFDTIICQYVLNVLLPEEQSEVLMSVSELLKPSGRAYFSVRRDLKRVGFRTHWVHKKKTYQCNVTLPFRSVFKNDFCEIYEYRHINQLDNGKEGIFENPSPETELISESATVYSICDGFPVSKGHALVIPKRKSETYFDLTEKEEKAIWMMVKRVKELLDKKYQPDGYNVGFNVNSAGGQTVFHTHVHVIPRYDGDVENPRGGVRGVIPGKGDYG